MRFQPGVMLQLVLHTVSIIFQLIHSAEHTLLVDIAMKAGVYTSRSDKLEDFNAVEYTNSL